MPLPTKREDLVALGYVFDNDARCRYCGARIEWWITPKGAKMPFSVKEIKEEAVGPFAPVERIDRIPHFSDCPNADQARRKK